MGSVRQKEAKQKEFNAEVYETKELGNIDNLVNRLTTG